MKGNMIQDQHREEHIERKAQLEKEIEALTKELEKKQEQNRVEEEKLTKAFESQDKMYAEALESYD